MKVGTPSWAKVTDMTSLSGPRAAGRGWSGFGGFGGSRRQEEPVPVCEPNERTSLEALDTLSGCDPDEADRRRARLWR